MQLFYGIPEDIENWMSLVTRVRWNFPGLETQEKLDEHKATVLRFMGKQQAICVKEGNEIAGVMLFSRGHNMICCLAVSPDYRRRGVASILMDEALRNLDRTKEISVSTFRADDEKGPAPRALYEKYGFVEDALIEEMDYPNQKYVLHPAGSERKDRQITINKMVREIRSILQGNEPSIYLYGSSVLNDFRLGWSDIDILVLTDKQITEEQAQKLVGLRQALLDKEPDNPYYLFDKSLELIEAGINVVLDWGFWMKEERDYAREFYNGRNIECEFHYIDISDETWKARLMKRNSAILAKETSAYYVDDNLAAKFGALFEKPSRDEIDVWVEQ